MISPSSYILWLPSWYPNKLGPYDGDFIQRHAKAVSAYVPVHVLHLVRDGEGVITRSVKIEENIEHNLKEVIIYYYSKKPGLKIFDLFFSMNKFGHQYRTYLTDFFSEHGLPSLVHVHIAFKAGLIARWLKQRLGIPYLLTEQWTIYLENAKPKLTNLTFAHQYMISKIMTNASLVLPVSDHLGKELQKKWPSITYEVVPNVVNSNIFFPSHEKNNDKLKLIHISTLTYQKDPESLFRAVGLLKKQGIEFSLDVFGPVNELVLSLIKSENIGEEVKLHGEVPQQVLSEFLRKSDALILYSRYETFGCVIIEANASGVPVIVTDTELMHELVEDNVNGVFVPAGTGEQLANALISFSNQRNSFDKNKIASQAIEKYSYNRVGKIYADIYARYIINRP